MQGHRGQECESQATRGSVGERDSGLTWNQRGQRHWQEEVSHWSYEAVSQRL